MEREQTFPIAPVTLASMGRVLQAFPIGWPFLGLIALLAVALVVGIAVEMTQAPAAALAGLAALLVLLLPFLWAAVASRRVAVALSDRALRVRGALFGWSEPLDALRTANARLIDLIAEAEYRPARKGWGADVPGCFSCGSGTLRNGERARWLLTDTARVVYVPSAGGRSILVSVRDPEGFLAALTESPVTKSA
jgi:hypothetical protein